MGGAHAIRTSYEEISFYIHEANQLNVSNFFSSLLFSSIIDDTIIAVSIGVALELPTEHKKCLPFCPFFFLFSSLSI